MRARRSHYEVLGVDKASDADEVKRAYRKKAASAHPDKGGDHDEMADINTAYEVLSDPERRLLYDRTGRDSAKAVEGEVKNLTLEAFADALRGDASDPLAHALRFVEFNMAKLEEHRKTVLKMRDELEAKRERVTLPDGPNLYHVLIDQRLEYVAHDLALAEQREAVCKAALGELKKYSSKVKVERPDTVLKMRDELLAAMVKQRMRPGFDFGGFTPNA